MSADSPVCLPACLPACKLTLCVQMVDLAWGVTGDELVKDSDYPSIKMEEIRKCQLTSSGPNFLVSIHSTVGSVVSCSCLCLVLHTLLLGCALLLVFFFLIYVL
jgi:hypothetical protein